jgi:hypothetical protein
MEIRMIKLTYFEFSLLLAGVVLLVAYKKEIFNGILGTFIILLIPLLLIFAAIEDWWKTRRDE